MKFADRLKGAGIALLILVICLPIAAVMTMITSPFWAWFETQFGIEAIGHSGPAQWCYLVCYGLIVAVCMLVWSNINRKRQARHHC